MRVAAVLLVLTAPLLGQQAQGPPARPTLAPHDRAALASADLATLPADVWPYTRYLVCGDAELTRVLCGHVNSLSLNADLVNPVPIRGGLLRLNLLDYAKNHADADRLVKVWERLFDPLHVVKLRGEKVVETWPGGIWPADGKNYPAGAFQTFYYRNTVAAAPWLSVGSGGKAAMASLLSRTRTNLPIADGRWFLWNTATQRGKVGTVAEYYDFLNITSEKAFEAVLRFDRKAAKDLERRRAVAWSGITWEPRRVEITRTVLGGYYFTGDSEKGKAVDASNPLRVLDDTFVHKFRESFGRLPNGLPVWLLANDQGVVQTFAPPTVIRSNLLEVNRSCLECHAMNRGESFVKDLDDVPIGRLSAVDYRTFVALRRQYLGDTRETIAQDRAGYERAVKDATGWTCQEYAAAFGRQYQAFDQAKVDAAWIGRDFGYSAAHVRAALERYDAPVGRLDAVLSIVKNGGSIGVQQYLETTPLLWKVFQIDGKGN